MAGKPSQSPLLQQGRNSLRTRHLSVRTEQAYLHCIKNFLRNHRNKRGKWIHPAEMGNHDINDYLTHLAVERNVAASTQNQAFCALLFLFRTVLEQEISVD